MAKKKDTQPTADEQPQSADQPYAAEAAETVESVHPQIGDTVLMVLNDHDRKGEIRPAIVVRVFNGTDGGGGVPLINVQQFTDGNNDITDHPVAPTTIWRTSLHHDQAGKQPGTWHWPEQPDEHA